MGNIPLKPAACLNSLLLPLKPAARLNSLLSIKLAKEGRTQGSLGDLSQKKRWPEPLQKVAMPVPDVSPCTLEDH